jgi:hypothetical protein
MRVSLSLSSLDLLLVSGTVRPEVAIRALSVNVFHAAYCCRSSLRLTR